VHARLPLPPVGGYVLAGGRSSRMGRDKALLPLAGKPLVEHALIKLRRICRDVAILSNNAELERLGPVVKDLHPDCGPMGGLEAALAHSVHDWNLVLPVDVPFPPTAFLSGWIYMTLGHAKRCGTRVALFNVGGVPQPTLVMLHREIAPYLTIALAQGRYKLFPELRAAAEDLAAKQGSDPGQGMMQFAWTEDSRFDSGENFPPGPPWTRSTPAQQAATQLYFANLNTPEDFAEAERHADVLDT
jgi:molybdopterin-guanine dinucleotide biosynthesis protein A